VSRSLLEVCNDWQIERAMILQRNPDARRIISACDSMIEQAVISARQMAACLDHESHAPKLKEDE